MTIFGAILALSRRLTASPQDTISSTSDKMFYPEGAMRHLGLYTHHFPRHWRGRCHTYDVRDDFLKLYEYKLILFLREVVSVVAMPFVLLFAFPGRAEQLVSFVKDVSAPV